MTEHEKLQQAYRDMGMNGGEDREAVKRRHKRLIVVWHPDRFPSADGKKDAEEELKKINNAKDILLAHFERAHSDSAQCPCRPTKSSSSAGPGPQTSGTGAGPGPGKRRTTQEHDREEAEAKRRSDERKRQADAEAAKRAQEAAAAAAEAASKYAAEDALTQQKRLQDESLRWKLSLALGAVWIGLTLYAWVGMSMKTWWHDFSWKWERDHSPAPAAPETNSNSSSSSSTPYIPPYNKIPGGNTESWLREQEQEKQGREQDAARQKQQDIYDTRMAIDRYQKTISHCQNEIAKVDALLSNPGVSDYEKRKSSSFGDAQRGYLSEAQANLTEAQRRFTELTGRPAAEANTREWGPNSSNFMTPTSDSGSALNGPSLNPSPSNVPVQPWKPQYVPNSTVNSSPLTLPSSAPTNNLFKQDPRFNLDPSKSTNSIFDKPSYLFKKQP